MINSGLENSPACYCSETSGRRITIACHDGRVYRGDRSGVARVKKCVGSRNSEVSKVPRNRRVSGYRWSRLWKGEKEKKIVQIIVCTPLRSVVVGDRVCAEKSERFEKSVAEKGLERGFDLDWSEGE